MTFEDALVADALHRIVFETKPGARFKGRLGREQRRAFPAEFVANDDLLRRDAEGGEVFAETFESESRPVFPGRVDEDRCSGVLKPGRDQFAFGFLRHDPVDVPEWRGAEDDAGPGEVHRSGNHGAGVSDFIEGHGTNFGGFQGHQSSRLTRESHELYLIGNAFGVAMDNGPQITGFEFVLGQIMHQNDGFVLFHEVLGSRG